MAKIVRAESTIREILQSFELSQKKEAAAKTKHDPPSSILRNNDPEDRAIHVPVGMLPADVVRWAQTWEENEEKFVEVLEPIDGIPVDAAHALMQATYQQFGTQDLRSTPGFFGSRPPTFISVPTASGDTVEVYVGRMGLPGFDPASYIETTPDGSTGALRLMVRGQVKRKEQFLLKKLIVAAREYLAANSLYRGHAIEYSAASADDDNALMVPVFFDTANAERPILNAELDRQIAANVEMPLCHRHEVENLGIPFKQGVVFSGRGGTGKSMMAKWLAKLATENGITFIYQKNVDELERGYELAARRLSPCVFFVEDCERAFADQKMTQRIQLILDGVNNKKDEVMVVFTTNFEEKIPPLVWRHGRINTYAHFDAPDAMTAEKLIRRYAGVALPGTVNLREVGRVLAGRIPSTVREAVEKAIKLEACSFCQKMGRVPRPEEVQISEENLLLAAISLKRHIELIEGKTSPTLSTVEKFGISVGSVMGAALIEAVKSTASGEAFVGNTARLESAHIEKVLRASYNGRELPSPTIDVQG